MRRTRLGLWSSVIAWFDLPHNATGRLVEINASIEKAATRLAERIHHPAPLGGLLEYDDDGVPFRGSCRVGSPYYFVHPNLRIEFNGEQASYCYEFDRRDGWILVDDPKTQRGVRRFGFVAASFDTDR